MAAHGRDEYNRFFKTTYGYIKATNITWSSKEIRREVSRLWKVKKEEYEEEKVEEKEETVEVKEEEEKVKEKEEEETVKEKEETVEEKEKEETVEEETVEEKEETVEVKVKEEVSLIKSDRKSVDIKSDMKFVAAIISILEQAEQACKECVRIEEEFDCECRDSCYSDNPLIEIEPVYGDGYTYNFLGLKRRTRAKIKIMRYISIIYNSIYPLDDERSLYELLMTRQKIPRQKILKIQHRVSEAIRCMEKFTNKEIGLYR